VHLGRCGGERILVTDVSYPVGEEMSPSLRLQANREITRDYNRVSRVWDQSFVPGTDEIRRFLLDAAGLRPGERVLDVGTGTGAAALLAARRVGKTGRVLGIDMSPAMLAKARAKASKSGLTNLTFRRMDGSALRLTSASFDVIISSFGTPEGLYDGEAVFREWLRVLRPGGRLCFVENPGIVSFYKILRRVLQKHEVRDPSPALAAKRRIQERVREQRAHAPPIIGDEPRKVAHLMRAAGFREVRVTPRRSGVVMPSAQTILRLFLRWSVADEYADMRPETRAEFRRDFLRALRPYETPMGLRLPARANFFSGRKGARAT
jgi:ubiquinone/menaquinone biosynthesis C-methylase UbiE